MTAKPEAGRFSKFRSFTLRGNQTGEGKEGKDATTPRDSPPASPSLAASGGNGQSPATENGSPTGESKLSKWKDKLKKKDSTLRGKRGSIDRVSSDGHDSSDDGGGSKGSPELRPRLSNASESEEEPDNEVRRESVSSGTSSEVHLALDAEGDWNAEAEGTGPGTYPYDEDGGFGEPDSDKNITFSADTAHGPRPIVKAGTLEKLVQRLTFEKFPDPNFVNAFLLTYRSFTTPPELLSLLAARYNVQPSKNATEKEIENFDKVYQSPIRLRVFNVLKRWVTVHFYDFEEDAPLLNSLLDFITNTMIKGSNVTMQKAGEQLKALIDKKLEGKVSEINFQFSVEPPRPILPLPMPPVLTLSILDNVEIARQLTLIEYNLYKKIKPQECLGQEWTKKATRDERAPNIMSMIQRFNAVGHWVTTEILKLEGIKERAALLSRFIEIAAACEKLNNYNAVMEIISGLQASPVYRLKHTWAAVGKSLAKKYKELQELMSREQNFQKFREHLHSVDPPCIPYLGVYLTDLTFIEDGNKDFVADNLINFDKRRKISQVIVEIQQYQQAPYCLEEVPSVRDFLLDLKSWDENEAYSASLKHEPKNMPAPSSVNSWKSRLNKLKDNAKFSKPSPQTPDQAVAASVEEEEEEEDWGELDSPAGYPFMQPDSKENLMLDTEMSALVVGVQPTIKAASLEKLVEKLTSEKYCDPSQVDAFLLTYRTFADDERLIKLLQQRFNVPKPKNTDPEVLDRWNSTKTLPIRLRVFNMAKIWIEKYSHGCFSNPSFLKEYMALADMMCSNGMEKAGNTLKASAQRMQETGGVEADSRRKPAVAIGQAPKPLIPSNLSTAPSLLDFNPEELARQLALIEQGLFMNVKYWELFNKNLWTIGLDGLSPVESSVTPLQKHSVFISNLVGSLVVKQPTPELAASYLTHWVKVAEKSLALSNFSAVAEIVIALEKPHLQKLKLVWHAVASGVRTSYNKLKDLVDIGSGFAKLRDRLHKSQPPTVPYIGAFFRALEGFEKQHVDKINGLINFEKQTLITGEIGLIIQSQQTLYCLESVTFLQEWIATQKVFNDTEIAEYSHHLQVKKTISKVKPKKDKKRGIHDPLGSSDDIGLMDKSPISNSSSRTARASVQGALKRTFSSDDGLRGQVFTLFQQDEEFRTRVVQDIFMPEIEKALEVQRQQLTEEFNQGFQEFKQSMAQGLIEFCKELEKSVQKSTSSASSPSQLLSASTLLSGLLSQSPTINSSKSKLQGYRSISVSMSSIPAQGKPPGSPPAQRPASTYVESNVNKRLSGTSPLATSHKAPTAAATQTKTATTETKTTTTSSRSSPPLQTSSTAVSTTAKPFAGTPATTSGATASPATGLSTSGADVATRAATATKAAAATTGSATSSTAAAKTTTSPASTTPAATTGSGTPSTAAAKTTSTATSKPATGANATSATTTTAASGSAITPTAASVPAAAGTPAAPAATPAATTASGTTSTSVTAATPATVPLATTAKTSGPSLPPLKRPSFGPSGGATSTATATAKPAATAATTSTTSSATATATATANGTAEAQKESGTVNNAADAAPASSPADSKAAEEAKGPVSLVPGGGPRPVSLVPSLPPLKLGSPTGSASPPPGRSPTLPALKMPTFPKPPPPPSEAAAAAASTTTTSATAATAANGQRLSINASKGLNLSEFGN